MGAFCGYDKRAPNVSQEVMAVRVMGEGGVEVVLRCGHGGGRGGAPGNIEEGEEIISG